MSLFKKLFKKEEQITLDNFKFKGRRKDLENFLSLVKIDDIEVPKELLDMSLQELTKKLVDGNANYYELLEFLDKYTDKKHFAKETHEEIETLAPTLPEEVWNNRHILGNIGLTERVMGVIKAGYNNKNLLRGYHDELKNLVETDKFLSRDETILAYLLLWNQWKSQ